MRRICQTTAANGFLPPWGKRAAEMVAPPELERLSVLGTSATYKKPIDSSDAEKAQKLNVSFAPGGSLQV